MINNDILRRLRYAFDMDDSKVIALFALADMEVTRAQISDWLKKEDDPAFVQSSDTELAVFLNGFINDKRGKKGDIQPQPEKRLTNNIIFRKLRIALNLKDDDILNILKLVNYTLSKHELSAFFRNPDHRQYRDCKDQILRNFLHGLQVKYRPDKSVPKDKVKVQITPPKASLKTVNRTVLSLPKKKPSAKENQSPWPKEKPTFQWNKD